MFESCLSSIFIQILQEWRDSLLKEQEKTPLTEKPKILVEDVGVKYYALDREVKYLINKAKNYKPKAKPKKPANETTDNGSKASNETKDSDTNNKTDSDASGDKTEKKGESVD